MNGHVDQGIEGNLVIAAGQFVEPSMIGDFEGWLIPAATCCQYLETEHIFSSALTLRVRN